jgi:hypothetical protein
MPQYYSTVGGLASAASSQPLPLPDRRASRSCLHRRLTVEFKRARNAIAILNAHPEFVIARCRFDLRSRIDKSIRRANFQVDIALQNRTTTRLITRSDSFSAAPRYAYRDAFTHNNSFCGVLLAVGGHRFIPSKLQRRRSLDGISSAMRAK